VDYRAGHLYRERNSKENHRHGRRIQWFRGRKKKGGGKNNKRDAGNKGRSPMPLLNDSSFERAAKALAGNGIRSGGKQRGAQHMFIKQNTNNSAAG